MAVGLVWAGKPEYTNDKKRSMPLSLFIPLLRSPGVTWFSLQKGRAADEIGLLPSELRPVDFTGALFDFEETAAFIENLDLVISVDTAVAHLAGALGKPVWTLLPFIPDWRWLLQREDSPWYPTMRLFRQSTIGDWGAVLNRVQRELGSQACRGAQVS